MIDTTEPAAALTELVDRAAIWDCTLRYSRGLDRLDEKLFRSAYWEDAATCHGSVNGTVDDFVAWWWPLQESRETCQHMVSNQSVEFAATGTAHAETYFFASIKDHGSTSVELLAGRYVDTFEKRTGEWRIKTRVLLFDWQATADASEMASRLATCHQGSRGRTDPSYERPIAPRTAPLPLAR